MMGSWVFTPLPASAMVEPRAQPPAPSRPPELRWGNNSAAGASTAATASSFQASFDARSAKRLANAGFVLIFAPGAGGTTAKSMVALLEHSSSGRRASSYSDAERRSG